MNLKTALFVILAALVVLAVVKIYNSQFTFSTAQGDSGNGAGENPIFQLNQSQPGNLSSYNRSASPVSIYNQSGSPLASDTLGNDSTSFLVDYVAPLCGDNICDAGESCSTCGDCACNSTQRCSAGGICIDRELCGDSICTNSERNRQSCCSDCGCAGSKLCNNDTQICLSKLVFSQVFLDQSIAQALALSEFVNYTFYDVLDDYLDEQAVKVVVLRCPGKPDFDCEAYVYFNSTGGIIEVEHTT